MRPNIKRPRREKNITIHGLKPPPAKDGHGTLSRPLLIQINNISIFSKGGMYTLRSMTHYLKMVQVKDKSVFNLFKDISKVSKTY